MRLPGVVCGCDLIFAENVEGITSQFCVVGDLMYVVVMFSLNSLCWPNCTYVHTYYSTDIIFMHTELYLMFYDFPFTCPSPFPSHLHPWRTSSDSLSALVGLHQFGSLGVAWTGTDAPCFEHRQDKEKTTATTTTMQQRTAPQQGVLLLGFYCY